MQWIRRRTFEYPKVDECCIKSDLQMINLIHLLAYITVILMGTWLVMDLAEARRVSNAIQQERVFVLEQRAICNFVNRSIQQNNNPTTKRTLTYNRTNYSVYEPRDSED